MQFNIKMDTKALLKNLNYYKTEAIPKATTTALNRTLKETVTEVKRIMTANYQIKSSDVARTMSIHNATAANPVAKIIAKDKQLGFSPSSARIKSAKWKATATKNKGVKIKIKKGAQSILKHAFIATMKSGHIGVFERNLSKGKKDKMVTIRGKQYTVKAYGIKEIVGPSIPFLIKATKSINRINNFINERLKKNFVANLKYFSSK